MGSGSGGGGSPDRVTTVNEPWGAQQGPLKYGFGQAQALYGSGGPKYFGGQPYINQSAMTQHGIGDLYRRGVAGSPLMNSAERMTQNTLNGRYLSPDSNPYLKATYDQALNSALPSLNATFSAAGRTGADAQQGALADTYGALGRDIYGQNYQQERNRQMQALIFAPQMAANDYNDIQAQLQAGGMKDQYSQNVLDATMNKFNFNQERPYKNLDWYMRTVGGQNYGGTSTQTQPSQGSNMFGNILGGGMTGAALGPMLGLAGPWGIGAGALMGLLGGM